MSDDNWTATMATALGNSDSFWRFAWDSIGTVNGIADMFSLHKDDVRARLKMAGITLRGRPKKTGIPSLQVPLVAAFKPSHHDRKVKTQREAT